MIYSKSIKACIVMCAVQIGAGYAAEERKIKYSHVFPSLVVRGIVGVREVQEALHLLPSTHPIIQELASRIDDLMNNALRTRYDSLEARGAYEVAQACVLLLVQKKVPEVVMYVSRKAHEILFIPKHERSLSFWLWVIDLFTALRFNHDAHQEHLLTMYIQDALAFVTAGESTSVRTKAAKILIDLCGAADDEVICSAVQTYQGVDIPALVQRALMAPEESEQALARAVLVLLLRKNNCMVLKGLKEYLEDRSLRERLYDFSRLVSPHEVASYALFEDLMVFGGPEVMALFLNKGLFIYDLPCFSPLTAVM